MAGVALESALSECDASLVIAPNAVTTLDSRAFVLLRLGRLDDAIGTYTAALAQSSQLAPSLYGRAVAWSRKGDKIKAQADRDAALKIDSAVQKRFEASGVTM
jgi:tetratricopeptide (TPR) repeat protein